MPLILDCRFEILDKMAVPGNLKFNIQNLKSRGIYAVQ